MNVFATSPCPIESARALDDHHVRKMTVECGQLVSTALREMGISFSGQYRSTHKHHPCTVACVEDVSYLGWTLRHGLALGLEFEHRTGKCHTTSTILLEAAFAFPECVQPDMPEPTRWPQAMPVVYQSDDPHESYRKYLAEKYFSWSLRDRKQDHPKWTKRRPPDWLLL